MPLLFKLPWKPEFENDFGVWAYLSASPRSINIQRRFAFAYSS